MLVLYTSMHLAIEYMFSSFDALISCILLLYLYLTNSSYEYHSKSTHFMALFQSNILNILLSEIKARKMYDFIFENLLIFISIVKQVIYSNKVIQILFLQNCFSVSRSNENHYEKHEP